MDERQELVILRKQLRREMLEADASDDTARYAELEKKLKDTVKKIAAFEPVDPYADIVLGSL